jgi:tetratricopeptide (TPR) repeat protein
MDAYHVYDTLRTDPSVGGVATAEAIRTATLIALREQELGLIDSAHLGRARQLAGASSQLASELSLVLDIAEALAAGPSGPTRGVAIEAQRLALVRLSQQQVAWAEWLRARMPGDRVATYLWLSLACGIYGSSIPGSGDRAPLADAAAVPLVAFKEAIACARNRNEALQAVVDAEPRFREAHFFQGMAALAGQTRPGVLGGAPDLEAADAEFRAAYEWRQDWPSLTLMIASTALTAEDFARAFEFYDRTLDLLPGHPDALLGQVRALTYLQRHAEAIAVTDALLAAGRHPGDARYWRALNEEQLGQHDQAWEDVELADTLLVNADVPKLAGIIAINRRELAVARQKLELALKRRAGDCQTGYYLQLVLSEQHDWDRAASVAGNCAACLDMEETSLRREIESLRSSKLSLDRRDRQIAKREQEIATNARMRATAWFNAAAASYNLGRREEARAFAERIADDPQFGTRARDLLMRLAR